MAHRKSAEWRRYEDTATQLLDKLASHIGLARVEPKQSLSGRSGTEWEVDAKGVTEGEEHFVVVECRRTKSRQSQAAMAALAFVLQDTGAESGIIVTPLPLQEGAKKVASAARIVHAQLDARSTPESFVLKFLSKLILGVTASPSATVTVDGPVLSRRCVECGNLFPKAGDATVCMSCSEH